ncbi:MAG: NAD(P)H-dependent oxidoreductase [Clostridia bacterium]|nr:NAD(P)H-dependent oxidoreductase [Clostridia bacterium]
MRTLIAYFSAEGTTAKVAKELAETIGADIFEIKPEKPYTAADIRWTNPLARCNREKFGNKDVPVIGSVENFSDYDTVLIGFPIWYGAAPNVVNTFCKGYDWSGKRVLAFATSGGSGIGKTAEKLKPYISGAASVDAKLVHSAAEVKSWLESE